MNSIDERVIRNTIEKQRTRKTDLYRALLVANCYDHILFEKPVETLRFMNVPRSEMRDVLMELIILQRTTADKTLEFLEY